MKVITAKNLTKKFNGLTALDKVSFEIEKGEIFGFLGPNGAGKTTTIKILTTLLEPTGGKVRVNGFDPTKEEKETRKSLGIVFQDPSLDDELTANENMDYHGRLYGMPSEERKKRIKEMLQFVELWDRRNDYVKHFSGGMRRRLEIARGLMHTPQILFLDEPTIGLDPQTRNHIWTYLKRLNETEGVTVFFTTHYMEEVEKVSSRIAIIDHGKLIAQGTAEELKAKVSKETLEDAFLAFTGHGIRVEASGNGNNKDHAKWGKKMWYV